MRRLARGTDDGFRSSLLPGLRSSEDAERLAAEFAFAAARLHLLEHDPPGLYGEVAAGELEPEERIWLALLIAYLGPLEAPDPFVGIQRVRKPWSSEELPDLDGVALGPRTAHDPARGTRTLEAYRRWAERAGSQQTGLVGEPAWMPERRFERAYERLALPGLHRDARFEFLMSLGVLGVLELRPGNLRFGGDDVVTVAAKRALGIGDPMLLERRATTLAAECAIPLAALDLGFYNWEAEERAGGGVEPGLGQEPDILQPVRQALGL